MGIKVCSKCDEELPNTSEYFHKDKITPDGLRQVCKVCQSILAMAARKRDIQKKESLTKVCTKCNESLPKTSEYFNKRKASIDGLQPVCRVCENIMNWRYYKNNSNRIQSNAKIYAKKNPHRIRERNVRKYYKVELDQVEAMMTKQRGCCAICKDSLIHPDSIKNYAIDHDHTTGKVRGLLCNHCNTALGLMKENKEAILQMITYLEENTP